MHSVFCGVGINFWEHLQNCEKRLLASSCLCVRLSVCQRGSTPLPLDGFSWNFIFQYLSKTCPENSSFIKIWQEKLVFYVKSNIHFWSYFTQIFLEWEMFRTKALEKIETHILCSITFFFPRKSCHLWDNVKNYWRAEQVTDDDMEHAHCMPGT